METRDMSMSFSEDINEKIVYFQYNPYNRLQSTNDIDFRNFHI